MDTLSAVQWDRLWAVVPTLIIVGYLYNLVIEKLNEKGYGEGFVSLEVAVGTFVTLLLLIPVIGPWAVLAAVIGFVASGTPMIGASLWRYIQQREAAKRAVTRGLTDEQTPTPAQARREREVND